MLKNRTVLAAMFAAAVLWMTATPLTAGKNRWTTGGPEGGNVNALVMDPARPGVLYAATQGGGVVKTIDGGESWTTSGIAATGPYITALVFDPATSTLYAASRNRLLKSADGAATWTDLALPPAYPVSVVTVDPTDPLKLYVGTGDTTVYRTADGGDTWAASALASTPGVMALAVDPLTPSRVFAGATDGLFVSTNGGADWTQVVQVGNLVSAIAISSGSPQMIYTGGFILGQSKDGGKNFTFDTRLTAVSQLVATSNSSVYGTNGLAIIQTTNGGKSWDSTAIPTTRVTSVALGPAGSGVFYASSVTDGVIRTQDAGATWQTVNHGLRSTDVRDISIAAAKPSVAYAATTSGTFKTANSGETWEQLNPLVRNASTIAADPRDASIVYIGGEIVQKSTDGGLTWTSIIFMPGRHAKTIAIDPVQTSTLYAAFADGLQRSADGGTTWRFIPEVLGGYYYSYLESVEVAPSAHTTVYASADRLYKSVDDGSTWTTTGTTGVDEIAIDPRTPEVVYFTSGRKLFKTADSGSTWISIGQEIDPYINDVVIDPRNPNNVYAATDAGVWRSADAGLTWSSFSAGLDDRVTRVLAIDPGGRLLHAATIGGVFSYEIVPEGPGLPVQALPTDPSRLPRLLEELRKSQSGAVRPGRPAGFLIPVAGNVQGANGTYFQSDVTLANWKTSSQDVLLAWLPQGLDGTSGPSFRLTLPPSTVSTATTIRDLIGKLGLYGVGSLVVIAIGADENLDPAGAIDGFSRIWTRQPGSSGSVSQSFAAISTDALREQDDAIALGLRQDDEFRTNVAIVNLDTQPRQFLVVARGDEGGATTTVDVPALSIVQVALPEQARGAITVTFHPVGGTTAFSWAACGSSIDNVTGDSWFSVAAPAPPVNSSANHSTE